MEWREEYPLDMHAELYTNGEKKLNNNAQALCSQLWMACDHLPQAL